jgi:RNA recognition motif. (a.k.a. RRM, RBD, or RNP domain)
VNGVELRYDRMGNSIGQAVVTFNRLPDAKKAVTDFHGRTLDGTPMQVCTSCMHAATANCILPLVMLMHMEVLQMVGNQLLATVFAHGKPVYTLREALQMLLDLSGRVISIAVA